MADYYILVGRTPIAVDLWTWGQALGKRSFEHDPWRVAHTTFDKVRVSTVFLGLDHNMREGGDPILFESMIFGGPLDQEQQRYSSYAEAERGHQELVTKARIAAAQIKSIKDKTGAT